LHLKHSVLLGFILCSWRWRHKAKQGAALIFGPKHTRFYKWKFFIATEFQFRRNSLLNEKLERDKIQAFLANGRLFVFAITAAPFPFDFISCATFISADVESVNRPSHFRHGGAQQRVRGKISCFVSYLFNYIFICHSSMFCEQYGRESWNQGHQTTIRGPNPAREAISSSHKDPMSIRKNNMQIKIYWFGRM